MTDRSRLTEIFSTVFKIPAKDAYDASRETLSQWDSLKHIELVFTVEEVFDISFLPNEMAELDSFEKILSKIRGRDT